MDLGIDIESGEFAIFKSGAGGSAPAYGHPVVIDFLGIAFESFVYFARRLITPVAIRPLGLLWSRVAPAGNKPGTQSLSAAPSRRRTSRDRARSRRRGDWRADVSPMRLQLTRSRRRFPPAARLARLSG